MFLEKTIRENSALADYAVYAHQNGLIRPDSYIVDVDTFLCNAEAIKKEADSHSIRLYYMLKQLGRNPYLARLLDDLGYDGAVVVDFKEAAVMMENGIRIGNAGHLVQIPESMLSSLISYGVGNMTVYSLEKARSINEAAGRLCRVQNVFIRVYDDCDMLYSGQSAGFHISRLEDTVRQLEALENIRISGVTSFPCYLYSPECGDIAPTANLNTVLKAERMLCAAGHDNLMTNTPSATCCRTLRLMAERGGNCGEPGHGLTGTTPLHAQKDLEERPCVLYLSEVSHRFQGLSYAYGGGHYRRSHVSSALVGRKLDSMKKAGVIPPSDESIDYHFGLDCQADVGDSVIMAYRFQIFVTRSDVVLVEGLSDGQPCIAAVYDSLGRKKQ